jgi:DNA processing protein
MVALLRTGRRRWNEYAELVEQLGTAATALEREHTAEAEPGGQTSLIPAERQGHTELIAKATADLERWDAQGMRLVTVLDPDYPTNLKAVHDRPPILFIAGRLTHADAKAVAVVGARQATPDGIRRAQQIAEHLVGAGYTVISGLAAGIDTAVHTATLGRNGRTVAVIGTGLARSYPLENQALQREIAHRCAVVSQFWPDAAPSKRTFPMRNAVMSGIALATVVVEASSTSGARTQARLALAQGRPIFLLDELVARQPWAQRAAQLSGTHVIGKPAEITNALERLISPGSLVA